MSHLTPADPTLSSGEPQTVLKRRGIIMNALDSLSDIESDVKKIPASFHLTQRSYQTSPVTLLHKITTTDFPEGVHEHGDVRLEWRWDGEAEISGKSADLDGHLEAGEVDGSATIHLSNPGKSKLDLLRDMIDAQGHQFLLDAPIDSTPSGISPLTVVHPVDASKTSKAAFVFGDTYGGELSVKSFAGQTLKAGETIAGITNESGNAEIVVRVSISPSAARIARRSGPNSCQGDRDGVTDTL